MKRLVIGCAVAVVVLFGARPVLASGFSVYEQSAKASGQAEAWIARADDAAASWCNPATLVRLEGTQVQFGLNYLDIGSDTTFTIKDIANNSPFISDGVLGEDWSDTFAARVGANWKVNDANPVPFGLLRDENPVPSGTLRPAIPDADRTVYTRGCGFLGEKFQVDAYWMYLTFDTRNSAGLFAPLPGQPATQNDGVIDGTYRSVIDLLGLTAGLRF